MHKRIIAAVGVLVALAGFTAFGQATIARIDLSGAGVLQCSGNVIEGYFVASGFDSSGTPIASFSATQRYWTSNGGALTQSAVMTSGASHAFYLALGSGTVSYVEVYLVADDVGAARSSTVRIHCDGRVEYLIAFSGDGRLNYANGDLINVLYAAVGPDEMGAIAVYSLDENSVGVFEGYFEYALFAPYLENPPDQNTFLGQVEYSRLYALTTGEFQIVISDPVEAKSYTTIFSAFPVTNVYFP